MMAPLCLLCDRPLHDVSDLYLRPVREYRHNQMIDAVYFCTERCEYAHLLIEGYTWPVRRRSVVELDM